MLNKFNASAKLYLLILIIAVSLLGLGLYGIRYLKIMNEKTRTLYFDRVSCIQQLANCRYEYAGVILPIPEKIKEGILTFDEALAQINAAEKNIKNNWHNYKLTYLTTEEARLVSQTEKFKSKTDGATEKLKAILLKKDTVALSQFIRKNPNIGSAPIVENLTRLMAFQVEVAAEVFNSSNSLYQQGSTIFWLLIFLTLVVTLSLSMYIIRNIKNLIKDMLESRNIIKQSELKYRSLIERASDAIFVVDKKGNYTEVNESMCDMTGYSRDELLQLNVVDIVDPEQLKIDPIVYGNGIPNNPYKRERRFIRKDRTIFDVEVNANLLFDENLLVIARDITERKKMESDLREAEQKFRTAFEYSAIGIAMVSLDGIWLKVNISLCQILGYSETELMAMSIFDVTYPGDDSLNSDIINRVLASEMGVAQIEKRYIRKNGTELWASVNIAVIKDYKGLPLYFVTQILDITERKKAEEAQNLIAENEEKLRAIFDNVDGAACLIDRDFHLIAFNKVFAKTRDILAGKPTEVGDEPYAFLPQDDKKRRYDMLAQVLNGKREEIESEYERNGEFLYYRTTFTPVIVDGKVTTISAYAIDITENKKAEHAQKRIIENEARLRAIFDNVEGSTCLMDTNFNLIIFNKVFAQTFTVLAGRGPQIGDEVYCFLPPDEKKRRYEILSRVLEGKKEAVEVDYIRNGDHLYFRTTFIPVIVDGKVTAISTYSIDYSERKKAELLILKEKELSETIINSLPGVFYLQSVSGEFLRWNRNFEVLTGYSKEEIKNLEVGELITEEDRGKVQDTVIKVFANGYAIVEARAKMKDNSQIPFLLTGIPIEYEGQLCLLGTGIDISSRIKAEEELRLSEQKYKLLFENNPVPMSMIAKDDFSIIAVNEATTNLYGYTKEELLQMEIKKMRPVEDLKLQAESYKKQLSIPTDFGVVKHLKKDGTAIFVNIISQDIFFEKRAVRLSLTNDVTEKIKAEEELRSSEQKYKLLFESNPVPLTMIAKDDLSMIAVNQAAADLYGYTKDEFLHSNASMVRLEEDLEEQLQNFQTEINHPTDRGVVRHVKKDGTIIFVNRIVNDIVFNGRAVRLVLSSDVTEKRKKEEELKKSEANLKTIMDATEIGYVLLDRKLNMVAQNYAADSFAKILFNKVPEKGQRLADFFPAERIEEFIKRSEEVFSGKKINYEINHTHVDGSSSWFDVRMFPIIENESEIFGLMVAISDVSSHKNSEIHLEKLNESLEKHAKELAVSNAELEQFAFVASHDLQEPLRMVTSFMAQLEKKYSDFIDDKGRQYIYFAVDGAKRMRQIILDLLDFSRVGRTEDKLEDVDTNKLVNEIISLNRRTIDETGASVVFEKLPVIHTFRTQIRQVFQNLIGNSLKYKSIDEEPIINITYSETKTNFQFAIQDNGIGIAQEYFDKIFIIFQRLHNKDEYSGTGMGLSITKKIVENLGGKIWVESTLGKGSTFYFTLSKSIKY